jgi:hypothetical protein
MKALLARSAFILLSGEAAAARPNLAAEIYCPEGVRKPCQASRT